MFSALKRCLLFLVLFAFSPVRADSDDDSSYTGFFVFVLILVFVISMICRCIARIEDDSDESDSERRPEPFRADVRNTPVQIYVVPRVRADNGFRNFNGYGNVPYQPRKSTVDSESVILYQNSLFKSSTTCLIH